ncbi:MAG: glycosyltransferase family 1 protein, partial [Actinomycetota bacterium]|nr:glycosyltransferase family 1 protein [Actinomycetota bacterium]
VIVCGRTGILVEPGDADALAAALDSLSEDREMLVALGCAAREHVRARFTIQRSVDALTAVYEALT